MSGLKNSGTFFLRSTVYMHAAVGLRCVRRLAVYYNAAADGPAHVAAGLMWLSERQVVTTTILSP